MRILLSTLFLSLAACSAPETQANELVVSAESAAQCEQSCTPSDCCDDILSARVSFGMQTAFVDTYMPFDYETNGCEFRLSHPMLSFEYSDDQGFLMKGDFPKNDDGDFEKFAILVRKEHIESLKNPDTEAFIAQLYEEYGERFDELSGENGEALIGEILMRLVDGVNQDGHAPSACIYQIFAQIDVNEEASTSFCEAELMADFGQDNIWQSPELKKVNNPVTINFPKQEGQDVTSQVGVGISAAGMQARTGETVAWSETEDAWVYKVHYLDLVFDYLGKVMPTGIEGEITSLGPWTPILEEFWFTIQLPTYGILENETTAFVGKGMDLMDSFVGTARNNGHLTATAESKIAEANYRHELETELGEGFSKLREEYQGNLWLQMIEGSKIKFGLRVDDLSQFTPESESYFNFEIPSDRQVIEVIPMIDMFARMGLSQLMMQQGQEAF